jgi:hypothetical protein
MVAEWLIPVPARRVLAAIQCQKNLFRQGIAAERGPGIAPRRYHQKPDAISTK